MEIRKKNGELDLISQVRKNAPTMLYLFASRKRSTEQMGVKLKTYIFTNGKQNTTLLEKCCLNPYFLLAKLILNADRVTSR